MQYLLVTLLNRLTHTAMAMSALFFVLFRRVPSTDIALFTVRLLCICVNARENAQNPIELRVIFMFAHKDRVLLNAPNGAEQLLLLCYSQCHSLSLRSSSPSLPHWLICQSLVTVASFTLYPLFFFSFFFSWTTLFCLCPVVLSLLMICLPAFFSSLSPAPLLQSFTPSFSPFFLFLLLFFSLSSCRPNVRLCE